MIGCDSSREELSDHFTIATTIASLVFARLARDFSFGTSRRISSHSLRSHKQSLRTNVSDQPKGFAVVQWKLPSEECIRCREVIGTSHREDLSIEGIDPNLRSAERSISPG